MSAADIVTGFAVITRLGDGWVSVQIGRGHRARQFTLSDAEARQLLDLLSELLA